MEHIENCPFCGKESEPILSDEIIEVRIRKKGTADSEQGTGEEANK